MFRNDSESEKSGMTGLVNALCQVRETEKMQAFLQEILTPAEFHDLALRWELMQRLQQGHTQRQIAQDLGVSLCKITRGARILKRKEAVSRKFLNSKEKQ